MQLGMVGLGRMGANIVRRSDARRTRVRGLRHQPRVDQAARVEGAIGGTTLEEFVSKLEKPRAVWVMIPAGITGRIVDEVAALLEEGDIIIDGGNSNYRDDVRRAKKLREQGIHYVDVGTSGGVFGLERGYCLMVGGDEVAIKTIEPDPQDDRPGDRRDRADTGPQRRAGPGGAGLSALRRRPAPGTSSRWCTTASSTASWPPSPRA